MTAQQDFVDGSYILREKHDAIVANLRAQINSLEQDEFDAADASSFNLAELKRAQDRSEFLEVAMRRVISLGFNEGCMFCGFKDKQAKIALEQLDEQTDVERYTQEELDKAGQEADEFLARSAADD